MTVSPLGRTEASVAQVRDPVCGMLVNPEQTPADGSYGGQRVHFCSDGCRRKYEVDHEPDGR